MTVANAIHMVMVISTIMPIMLIEVGDVQIGDDSPERMWYIWGSRVLTLTEQAVLYFTLLMTINRFAVFVYPHLLVAFTHTRGYMILSMLAWAYIVFIVAWNVYSGATKTFSRKKLSMQDTILGNNLLTTVTKLTSMITPLLTGADSWVQWVWTIFSYSSSIVNQMINPLLFLTMNKMVRSVLRNFFRSASGSINSDLDETPKRSQSAPPGLYRNRVECFRTLETE
ncbi:hypothetical protein OSTOST_07583 [Ostertagia ostertagi]